MHSQSFDDQHKLMEEVGSEKTYGLARGHPQGGILCYVALRSAAQPARTLQRVPPFVSVVVCFPRARATVRSP